MKMRFFAQVDSPAAAAPAAEPVKPVDNTPAAPAADLEKPTEPAAASEIDEVVRPTSSSTIVFGGIFVLVAGGVILYAMGGVRVVRRLLATHLGVGQFSYRKLASEEP